MIAIRVVGATRQNVLTVPNAALRFRPKSETAEEARSTATSAHKTVGSDGSSVLP
jgi:HlyD family secretion protein